MINFVFSKKRERFEYCETPRVPVDSIIAICNIHGRDGWLLVAQRSCCDGKVDLIFARTLVEEKQSQVVDCAQLQ